MRIATVSALWGVVREAGGPWPIEYALKRVAAEGRFAIETPVKYALQVE